MNLIYKNNILYINILECEDFFNLEYLKKKILNILDQYQTQNIILNLKSNIYIKNELRSLIYNHYKKYEISLLLDV